MLPRAGALEAAARRRCRGPRTRPSGCCAGAEVGAPAVVLEAREHLRAARGRPSSETSIATLPIRRGPSSRTVRTSSSPTPAISLVAERVGVPEQLVAAAHAEHHRAARGRGVQPVALGLDQVLGAQALVAVLAAADVEQVVGVGVELLAEPARRDSSKPIPRQRSDARARAGCRGRRRCSSGPGTARTRAAREPRSARGARLRHEASPPSLPDVLVGRRDRARPARRRSPAPLPRARAAPR